jgi:hypothetical protein
MALSDLVGSRWRGTAELWLDPVGNMAHTSECTLSVEPTGLSYSWQHEGKDHRGTIALDAGGGTFTDTFHAPQAMRFGPVSPTTALIDLLGSYDAGEGPPWGWRLIVSLRPPWEGAPESLVLQMTNITPWGEEARAVRMVATRV